MGFDKIRIGGQGTLEGVNSFLRFAVRLQGNAQVDENHRVLEFDFKGVAEMGYRVLSLSHRRERNAQGGENLWFIGMGLEDAFIASDGLPEVFFNHKGVAQVVLRLGKIRNPGNLGTILRTCDAVGCAGVILLGDTADPYDNAAVRGAMGAHFSQRLVRTDIKSFAAWKKSRSLTMIGTSDTATSNYQEITYHQPVILCMGDEQHGLSDDHTALCNEMVRIPMVGRSDSLNLAVATAVILYEIFNQHRRHGC